MLGIQIISGDGEGHRATVNSDGTLAVGPPGSGDAYTVSATVINTGYNYTALDGGSISPVSGKRFVIDTLIIFTDRNVGATSGAIINVYEADGSDSATSVKDIIKDIEIIKNDRVVIPLNYKVTEGKWVNLKTDDNNVGSTIIGHYVDV